jgi:hypothetical protein
VNQIRQPGELGDADVIDIAQLVRPAAGSGVDQIGQLGGASGIGLAWLVGRGEGSGVD